MSALIQQPQEHPNWENFKSLGWYDGFLAFIFRFTAISSELMLAFGVVLATANHLMHGVLFSTVIHGSHGGIQVVDTSLFQVWAWTQAVGFEASAGIVLLMALDANRNNDAVKRNILIWLMVGLAVVGTVMLFMSYVESSTGIQEIQLPWQYNATMAFLRSIVSVAYIIVGRVKGVRFSGTSVLQTIEVPDVYEKLNEVVESLFQLKLSTERNLQQIEMKVQSFESFQQIERSFQNFETGFQEYLDERLSETLSPIIEALQIHTETISILPNLSEQLGQIERATTYQLRTVSEEVTRFNVNLEQGLQEVRRPIEVPAIAIQRPQFKAQTTKEKVVSIETETEISVFNKKAFVFQCLTENPEMAISEIQRRATERGQSISVGSVSGYRKDFIESQRLKVVSVEMVES